MIYSLSLHVLVYNVKGEKRNIYSLAQLSCVEKQHPFDLPILSPSWPPFTSSCRKERLAKSQFRSRSMKYCTYNSA